MDKQDLQSWLDGLRRRFQRRPPQPLLIYGRRAARAAGFSPAELAEAGLDQQQARRFGLPVDSSRLSSLGSNVSRLREYLRR